jgi:serine/threonine-protein kinase
MPNADLRAGESVAGFRIESEAARGGMGVVYRATDVHLERQVALKVIAEDLARDGGFRQRFIRESRIAASFRHPHVVTVFAAGEADGRLYIAMDYIDGIDLRSLLERDGRLEPMIAATILRQVASALDAAHARTLVHRDVKPGNILIAADAEGLQAFLTDFGLTKETSSKNAMTQSGAILGTIDYIAPEQIRGEPLDGRADVYALGCVYYEMLTGRVPFKQGSLVAKLFAHLNEPVPAIRDAAPDVPERLDHVVRRAMAKDPDDRYPTAGEMARAASAATGGTMISPPRSLETVEAPRPPAPAPAEPAWADSSPGAGSARPGSGAMVAPALPPPAEPRERRRRRWPLALGAALLALAAVAAALVIVLSGEDEPTVLSAEAYQTAVIESTRPTGQTFSEVAPQLPLELDEAREALRATQLLGTLRQVLDQTLPKLVAVPARPDAVAAQQHLISIRQRIRDKLVEGEDAAEAGRSAEYQAALRDFAEIRAEHAEVAEEYGRLGYTRLQNWANCASGNEKLCPLTERSPVP